MARKRSDDDQRPFDDLGGLQREIIAAVWQLEEATVQEIRDHLVARGRRLAYTTVLSAMQKLERLGWLSHRAEGRTYIYRARRSRQRESRRSLGKLLQHMFEGDRVMLLQQMLAEDDFSDEELRTLRRLIQDRRREMTDE